MPGNYLIIDLSQEPPALVTAEDVIPAAIVSVLNQVLANQQTILMNQGTIMNMAADQQGQIQSLADGMTAVSTQITSASAGLAQWIADNQSAPLDFTPALNALASVQAAGGVVDGLLPQAPQTPIDPVPLPPDPAPDPSTPVTDPGTPDPTLPPGGDIGTATDPTTTPDGGTLDPSQQAPPDDGSGQPQVNPLGG